MTARSLLLSLPLVALLSSGEARASDFEGVFVPVGANVGGSMRTGDGGGLVLGAEASVVYFNGAWVGAYADALWDFGPSELRHSIGPEIGLGPLGVDFGYLGAVRDGNYRPGYAARGMLTIALLSVYGRYGHVFGEPRNEEFAEVGVLLKVPIPVGSHGRPPRPPPPPPRADSVAVPVPPEPAAPPKPVAGDPAEAP